MAEKKNLWMRAEYWGGFVARRKKSKGRACGRDESETDGRERLMHYGLKDW